MYSIFPICYYKPLEMFFGEVQGIDNTKIILEILAVTETSARNGKETICKELRLKEKCCSNPKRFLLVVAPTFSRVLLMPLKITDVIDLLHTLFNPHNSQFCRCYFCSLPFKRSN